MFTPTMTCLYGFCITIAVYNVGAVRGKFFKAPPVIEDVVNSIPVNEVTETVNNVISEIITTSPPPITTIAVIINEVTVETTTVTRTVDADTNEIISDVTTASQHVTVAPSVTYTGNILDGIENTIGGIAGYIKYESGVHLNNGNTNNTVVSSNIVEDVSDATEDVINATNDAQNVVNDITNTIQNPDFAEQVDGAINPAAAKIIETGLMDLTTGVGGIVYDISRYVNPDWLKLVNGIINNIDSTQIPLINFSHCLDVEVRFAPLSLINYDEVSGDISIAGSLNVFWTGENLPGWNPETTFNGRHTISIASSSIWTPNFVVRNPSPGSSGNPISSDRLKLTFDKKVTWQIISVIEASCSAPDVTTFPFDRHDCYVDLALWGYDSSEVRINASMADGYKNQFHGQKAGWVMKDAVVLNNKDHIPYFTISLQLSRMYGYFVLNILIPPILLSVLNPCVFLLPVASGERVSFAVVCFLSFSVFMTILAENMPKSTPKMAFLSYFLLYMLFQSVGVMLCVIISFRMFQNHENGDEIPSWILFVTKWTRRLACLKGSWRCCKIRRSASVVPVLEEQAEAHTKSNIDTGDNNCDLRRWSFVSGSPQKMVSRLDCITVEPEAEAELQMKLPQACDNVVTWQTASLTFDALFFCFFFFCMLLSLLITFCQLGLI